MYQDSQSTVHHSWGQTNTPGRKKRGVSLVKVRGSLACKISFFRKLDLRFVYVYTVEQQRHFERKKYIGKYRNKHKNGQTDWYWVFLYDLQFVSRRIHGEFGFFLHFCQEWKSRHCFFAKNNLYYNLYFSVWVMELLPRHKHRHRKAFDQKEAKKC